MPEFRDGLVARNRFHRLRSLFSKLFGLENPENGSARTRHQGDISPKFNEHLLHFSDKRVRREHGDFKSIEIRLRIQ